MLNPESNTISDKAVANPSDLTVPFLNLKGIFREHREEFLEAIAKVLDQCAYIGGAEVQKFEKQFSVWVDESLKSHTLGCANGTDAITLGAKSLNLPNEATAVLPAMTFAATAEGLVHAGLKLKLVDVRSDSWLIDCNALESTWTKDCKLIVPVHLYGQMAEMDRIQKWAQINQAYVLEDAAQAHGSLWMGNPVGHYSDLATFSFYPGKNLGAFGDGGAILSRNSKIIDTCRALSNHGGIEKYKHDLVGYNSRLDGIQAAVLNVKLKYISDWNTKRRNVATYYQQNLSGIQGLVLPTELPQAKHTFHLYVIQVEKREDFMNHLKRHQIDTGIHYPAPLHQIPAFAKYFAGQQFPNAERLAKHAVSLPMCPTLELRQLEKTVKAIRSYFGC